LTEQLALLPEYLTAHLRLTLLALLIGATLSLPLGVWATRRREVEAVVLGVASVLQTVPGLAMLALMVPLLGAVGGVLESCCQWPFSSIGFLPALIALSLYSILPMLRNTVTGIAGVDPALVEAARGVGMTEGQMLWRVQLPLALPVIVAGLRTATVWVVGTATLATPVGATSLGNYIFSGLQTRNFAAVWMGSLAAAGLAVVLDGLIRALESGLAVRSRSRVSVAAGGLAILILAALLGLGGSAGAGRRGGEIAIGAKTFNEQYILAQLMAQQIEARTQRTARVVESLGSTVAFDALRSGELDVYVDYSGTIWATIMKRETLPAQRSSVVREVADYLAGTHGVSVVGALGFENTYALAMRNRDAKALGIRRLSQLAGLSSGLEIGGDYEFFARAEWAALVRAYGFAFRTKRSMDSALMYQAAAGGDVDVISAFSTDGRIAALDLRLLEDDRGVIPPYDALILARPGLMEDAPRVVAALTELAGTIDAGTMQRLNLAVDQQGRSPAAVAREFRSGFEP